MSICNDDDYFINLQKDSTLDAAEEIIKAWSVQKSWYVQNGLMFVRWPSIELLLSAATCWMLKDILVQLEFKYFHCFSKAVNPTPNNIQGIWPFFSVEMY